MEWWFHDGLASSAIHCIVCSNITPHVMLSVVNLCTGRPVLWIERFKSFLCVTSSGAMLISQVPTKITLVATIVIVQDPQSIFPCAYFGREQTCPALCSPYYYPCWNCAWFHSHIGMRSLSCIFYVRITRYARDALDARLYGGPIGEMTFVRI